jgi:hypothetical protein
VRPSIFAIDRSGGFYPAMPGLVVFDAEMQASMNWKKDNIKKSGFM